VFDDVAARLTYAIAHRKAPHLYRERDRDAVTRSRIAEIDRFDLLEHRRCSIVRSLAFFHNRVGNRDNREFCAGIRSYCRTVRFQCFIFAVIVVGNCYTGRRLRVLRSLIYACILCNMSFSPLFSFRERPKARVLVSFVSQSGLIYVLAYSPLLRLTTNFVSRVQTFISDELVRFGRAPWRN